MDGVLFNDLADYLRHGREIEFAYRADSILLRTILAIGICVMIPTTFFWKQFADLKIKKLLYQKLLLQLLRI